MIVFRGKHYLAHQIICRAFHGLAPEDKAEVDHIDRCKTNNRPSNIHWASHKENVDNRDCVDQAFEKYKTRFCEDKKAYRRCYNAAHREEQRHYRKAYYEKHHEEQRAYWAAKVAKMKAQGLAWKKGPSGKWGWFPRVCKSEAA